MADAPPHDASPPDTPPPDSPVSDDRYAAEGCINLWLRLWILGTVFGLVLFADLIERPAFRNKLPNYDDWMFLPYMLAGVAQTVFVFGLLHRRMWGFVGLWVVGLLIVALNFAAGISVAKAVSGLIGLVVLYWLLQIGGERSGWSRLS